LQDQPEHSIYEEACIGQYSPFPRAFVEDVLRQVGFSLQEIGEIDVQVEHSSHVRVTFPAEWIISEFWSRLRGITTVKSPLLNGNYSLSFFRKK
jgi:hypothetical protein